MYFTAFSFSQMSVQSKFEDSVSFGNLETELNP